MPALKQYQSPETLIAMLENATEIVETSRMPIG